MLNIESGMLASKTIEYDIFQKRYDVQHHNYFDDFNKQKKFIKKEDITTGIKILEKIILDKKIISKESSQVENTRFICALS